MNTVIVVTVIVVIVIVVTVIVVTVIVVTVIPASCFQRAIEQNKSTVKANKNTGSKRYQH